LVLPPTIPAVVDPVVEVIDELEAPTKTVLPVKDARDVAAAGVGRATVISASDDEAAAAFVAETYTVVVLVVRVDVTVDTEIAAR
jgi:hypothetical protein